MPKLFSILTLILLSPVLSFATTNPSDPLDPMYLPSIDSNPADYPSNVWVTGPLAKVHQDTGMPGQIHWVQVSTARNEFQSFQVHVRAGANPIVLNVTVSDLVNAQTSTRIPATTNIIVYREAYMSITTLSDLNGTLGPTPDPLIPAVDPYYRQTRNAFPFTIVPNHTQSVWVDVLTPSAAPSGYYTGTVTVSNGSAVLATLPIRFKVWDWVMPSSASLKSTTGVSFQGFCDQVYGSLIACTAYPGANTTDKAVTLTHIDTTVLFLDHRVSLSGAIYPPVTNNDFTAFDATYGPLLNGTPANTKTMLPGARMTTLQYPFLGSSPNNATNIQQWVTHFQTKGWLPTLFEYHCDEPPTGCSWATTLSEANFVHASSNPHMQTLITANMANAAANGLIPNAIDIIVPVVNDLDPQGGSNQRSAYNAYLSDPTKHIWWYQSCMSNMTCSNGNVGPRAATWPVYTIDSTPVRNRVFQWLAYLNQIEGELYYGADTCFIASDGCITSDPWTNVYNFGGNGDGTLFYPGSVAKVGGTTPIPIPSVRLKHIRDGMQDYEYLIALDKAGQAAFARAQAQSFITNSYTFNTNPDALLNAREALGTQLHQIAHPATGSGPKNLKNTVP
jgi:Domain of unknown function (DUF4091)